MDGNVKSVTKKTPDSSHRGNPGAECYRPQVPGLAGRV